MLCTMNGPHFKTVTGQPRSTLGFTATQASDVGQLRDHNEDSSAWLPELGVAIVADGVGGYRAGEVASAIATSQLVNSLLDQWLAAGGCWSTTKPNFLEAAMRAANRALVEAASQNPDWQGMATTAVVAVFDDQKLWWAHIGDSRLYRLRQSVLTPLTHDHTLRQQLINQGLCTPEEAVAAVGSNIITRALGTETMAQLETGCHSVQAGDRYLLCTDGLHDMLEDAEIARTLGGIEDLQQSVYRLLDLANLAGGRDNITAVLVASSR